MLFLISPNSLNHCTHSCKGKMPLHGRYALGKSWLLEIILWKTGPFENKGIISYIPVLNKILMAIMKKRKDFYSLFCPKYKRNYQETVFFNSRVCNLKLSINLVTFLFMNLYFSCNLTGVGLRLWLQISGYRGYQGRKKKGFQ